MPKGRCTFTLGECNGTAGFRINNSVLLPNSTKHRGELFFVYEHGQDIEFQMFGKTSRRDTRVINNEIVQDKYINIETLQLEYIKLENWHLHNDIFDPYFGFDREVRTLHIPENFVDWWLDYAI